MVIKIQVVVFWVVTPCSDVVGYQCSGGPSCLQLQGEEWSHKAGMLHGRGGNLQGMLRTEKWLVAISIWAALQQYSTFLRSLILAYPAQSVCFVIHGSYTLLPVCLCREVVCSVLRLMSGAIPQLPSIFMAWCLVQHRDNFTVTLPIIAHFHCLCHHFGELHKC